MRRAFAWFAALTFIFSLSAVAGPTAILVDTSRSITPNQFEETKALLQSLVPALLEKGPVAVYAFNDAPVKVGDYTTDASAVNAAIGKLQQGGNFTLLYDAVFTAVREIQAKNEAGTILLVTDGRDENSAVTLQDAASKAGDAHVAIVPVGIGFVDEKTLRRLATLTGGQYAGRLPAIDAAGVKSAWMSSVASLIPVAPPPAPVAAPPAPAAPAVPAAPPPETGRSFMWLLYIAIFAGIVVLIVGVVILLKRTRGADLKACEKCGRPLNLWETECPVCLAQKLAITNPGTTPQTPAAEVIPEIDPSLMQKGPASEMLEHTIVMDEVPVLILQRGKNPPRMFQLPMDQVVSVGRDKVNTISIADQTLSGQHFRIVPKAETYYLVDLQSTNGTYLNGERVTLKELKPGAVIHAGQCDFTFKREQKRLN